MAHTQQTLTQVPPTPPGKNFDFDSVELVHYLDQFAS